MFIINATRGNTHGKTARGYVATSKTGGIPHAYPPIAKHTPGN